MYYSMSYRESFELQQLIPLTTKLIEPIKQDTTVKGHSLEEQAIALALINSL